jgi:hypothetical protein
MHATAPSARLENLRDRRLEAFMRVGDDVLALEAVRRLQGSLPFLRGSERTSILEHRAMQRQCRKLLTNDGALSAGTAHYGRPWPITWFSKAGGSPTTRCRRPRGRTLVGRPEGQDAQSERFRRPPKHHLKV